MKPTLLIVLSSVLLGTFPALSAEQSSASDLLMSAIEGGNIAAVKSAITTNPQVINTSDEYGFTPLHRAAGSFEIANLLIASGAEVNAQSTNGGTVVQHAISEGNVPLVKVLLANGANLEVVGADGVGSLERVAWVSDPVKVAALVELIKQKSPTMISTRGMAAVYLSVDRVNPFLVNELVKNGVNPVAFDFGFFNRDTRQLLAQRLVDPNESPEVKTKLMMMKKVLGYE